MSFCDTWSDDETDDPDANARTWRLALLLYAVALGLIVVSWPDRGLPHADNRLTWAFERPSSRLAAGDQQAAVREAFARWGDALDADFAQVAPCPQGAAGTSCDEPLISVRFADDAADPDATFADPYGHARSIYSCGTPGPGTCGQIVISDMQRWCVKGATADTCRSLPAALTHLVGHALGVADAPADQCQTHDQPAMCPEHDESAPAISTWDTRQAWLVVDRLRIIG